MALDQWLAKVIRLPLKHGGLTAKSRQFSGTDIGVRVGGVGDEVGKTFLLHGQCSQLVALLLQPAFAGAPFGLTLTLDEDRGDRAGANHSYDEDVSEFCHSFEG
jgi:hypothetical protein